MHLAVAISGLLLILFTGVMLADEQLTLDPQYQVALGKVYLERDRTLLARNVLSRVLMQHPYSEEAFLGFWETFERRGDYQAATQALERFLGSEHPPPLSIFYLAEAYRLSSKFQAATDCYRKALAQGFPEQACRIGLYLCLIGQQSVSGVVGLLED